MVVTRSIPERGIDVAGPDRPFLENRLTSTGGRPLGFDYLRIVLSLLIVTIHSFDVSYGPHAIKPDSAVRPLIALVVPLFFALSGFLVAGSLERCRALVSFLGFRIIRLAPALGVETVLGALLLGPLFTTLALGAYFSDPLFPAYFANMVGKVQYLLPGVFEQLPWPRTVNAQLWTLPYELYCYALIAALGLVGITKFPKLMLVAALIFNLFLLSSSLMQPVERACVVSGGVLVLTFLFGIVFYLGRRRILWDASLFWSSAAVALLSLSWQPLDALAAAPISYMAVYLGLTNPRKTIFAGWGDYSYGIFIDGFPIQQAVATLVGPLGWHWYVNLFVSLPLILALSILSWLCIERPALRLRTRVIRFEDSLLGAFTSIRTSLRKGRAAGELTPMPLPLNPAEPTP